MKQLKNKKITRRTKAGLLTALCLSLCIHHACNVKDDLDKINHMNDVNEKEPGISDTIKYDKYDCALNGIFAGAYSILTALGIREVLDTPNKKQHEEEEMSI
jgi:hypothetical protein